MPTIPRKTKPHKSLGNLFVPKTRPPDELYTDRTGKVWNLTMIAHGFSTTVVALKKGMCQCGHAKSVHGPGPRLLICYGVGRCDCPDFEEIP